MKNKELKEILAVYPDDFEIAIEETFGNISIVNNDFTFEEVEYKDNSCPRPYYKLVLTPMKEENKDSYEIIKDKLL